MPVDPSKPMPPGQARRVLNGCLEEDTIEFTPHAMRALRDDALDLVDAYVVLRRGVFEQPEWERGEWRYRIHTEVEGQAGTIYLVLAFELDEEAGTATVVVTAWRKT